MIAGRDDELERDRASFQRDVRDGELVRAGRPGQAEDLRRDPPTSGVGVLDRCVAILRAVEDGARSFTDIVAATGLTRSTAHRLLQGLEDHGFLLQIGGLGYALGPRLLALAASASQDLPLSELAHPSLERLARSTGESAQLYVRDGDRRVCIDAADRARLVQTADDPDRLERTLVTTRRRGWAESVAERAPGVASVSAPIAGPDGALVAVISVSGPASRLGSLRAKRYAPAVLEAAREIEGTLGG